MLPTIRSRSRWSLPKMAALQAAFVHLCWHSRVIQLYALTKFNAVLQVSFQQCQYSSASSSEYSFLIPAACSNTIVKNGTLATLTNVKKPDGMNLYFTNLFPEYFVNQRIAIFSPRMRNLLPAQGWIKIQIIVPKDGCSEKDGRVAKLIGAEAERREAFLIRLFSVSFFFYPSFAPINSTNVPHTTPPDACP